MPTTTYQKLGGRGGEIQAIWRNWDLAFKLLTYF